MAKVVDLTKHLTLDEIRERDIDNLNLVLKASHPVKFESKAQCEFWKGETLRNILAKLGVDLVWKGSGNPKLDRMQFELASKRVDKQMRDRGVRVEVRKDPSVPFTRHGIYVYYENEIAYFISIAMYFKKRAGNLILPGNNGAGERQLFCMTNWKE